MVYTILRSFDKVLMEIEIGACLTETKGQRKILFEEARDRGSPG